MPVTVNDVLSSLNSLREFVQHQKKPSDQRGLLSFSPLNSRVALELYPRDATYKDLPKAAHSIEKLCCLFDVFESAAETNIDIQTALSKHSYLTLFKKAGEQICNRSYARAGCVGSLFFLILGKSSRVDTELNILKNKIEIQEKKRKCPASSAGSINASPSITIPRGVNDKLRPWQAGAFDSVRFGGSPSSPAFGSFPKRKFD